MKQIIINMGESYSPKKKNKKYNWKKHLKTSKNNQKAWIILDYHSRDENNNTVYIDKYGNTHDHASLQRLTNKGYRLHFN